MVKPVLAFYTPGTASRVYAAYLDLVSTGAAEWHRNDPGACPKHIPAHVLDAAVRGFIYLSPLSLPPVQESEKDLPVMEFGGVVR